MTSSPTRARSHTSLLSLTQQLPPFQPPLLELSWHKGPAVTEDSNAPSRPPGLQLEHEDSAGCGGCGGLPTPVAPSLSRDLAQTCGSARPATSPLATARSPRAVAPRPSPAQSSRRRTRMVTSCPVSPPGPTLLQGGKAREAPSPGGRVARSQEEACPCPALPAHPPRGPARASLSPRAVEGCGRRGDSPALGSEGEGSSLATSVV